MANIYRANGNRQERPGFPEYELREGKIYRTVFHPLGISEVPDYEVRARFMIYRTLHHPMGVSGLPDYEFRGGKIYRTKDHPQGSSEAPEYEISLLIPKDRKRTRRVAQQPFN
ncbi:MAG TPA: hypothetical protein VLS90_05080 [Thermodesulfobacteriota bacterium]|nr:hypothetical protein [Thermodesulfobacteriota bacterium]